MSLQGEIHVSGLSTCDKAIKKMEQRDRDRRGAQINKCNLSKMEPKSLISNTWETRIQHPMNTRMPMKMLMEPESFIRR